MASENVNGVVVDVETKESSTSSKSSYCCSCKIVELLLCTIPAFSFFLELHEVATPFQREIPYQIINGEIVYPFMYNQDDNGETVPPWGNGLAIALPALLQVLVIFACNSKLAYSRGDMMHKTACVYIMAQGVTQLIICLGKLYCGYFRPYFLYACDPDENWECTGNFRKEQQARMSFPSGHAGLSLCSMLIFSYFLADTFGYSAYKRKVKQGSSADTEPALSRIVEVLCYLPVGVSVWIGLSRVHDDHHHPADVIGGALVGGSVSTLIYNIWFS